MRKMFVAFVILSLIIGAILWEQTTVEGICNHMTSSLEAVEKQLEEKSPGLGKSVEELGEEWHKREKILDFVTPHEDTDEVNEDYSDLSACVDKGLYDKAYVILHRMQEHLEHIHSKNNVHITNIF